MYVLTEVISISAFERKNNDVIVMCLITQFHFSNRKPTELLGIFMFIRHLLHLHCFLCTTNNYRVSKMITGRRCS